MGGKSRTPPPPNYGPLVSAMQSQAQQQQQFQQSQMAWAQQESAANRAQNQPIIDAAMARQRILDQRADEDYQRYRQVAIPLRDQMRQEALDYASPERQVRDAGRAAADVSAQFTSARAAAQDRLESFGIDPSQVRAGALDVATRIAEAQARAGAGTMAAERTAATGRAMRADVTNMESGLPAQGLAFSGAAGQSGQLAGNTNLATSQLASNMMGNPTQWGQLANSSMEAQGNAMRQGYQNQLGYAQEQRQSRGAGWGQILGLAGGVGLSMMMPGLSSAFTAGMSGAASGAGSGGIGAGLSNVFRWQEGGAVGDEPPPHQGIPITPAMSPSRGAIPDDIPARLNAGEFVVPADVLKWKGEEFFQKTIQQAREKKTQAIAKPTVGIAPPQAPVVDTTRQAIPAFSRGGSAERHSALNVDRTNPVYVINTEGNILPYTPVDTPGLYRWGADDTMTDVNYLSDRVYDPLTMNRIQRDIDESHRYYQDVPQY